MANATSRTPAEKAAQLAELEAAVLSGTPPRRALALHRERHGLGRKLANKDLATLRSRWAAAAKWSRDHPAESRGLAVARCDLLHRRAAEAGELGVAVAAERLRCEVLGLVPVLFTQSGEEAMGFNDFDAKLGRRQMTHRGGPNVLVSFAIKFCCSRCGQPSEGDDVDGAVQATCVRCGHKDSYPGQTAAGIATDAMRQLAAR